MRILAFIPNDLDGTSFYRGKSALSELYKIDKTIHIDYATDRFRFMDAKGYDLCFFQRPDNAEYVKTIRAIKELRIPVVVDYDDYLLGVPEDNRYSKMSKALDNPYEHYVFLSLKFSDALIVSTGYLKEKLSKHQKNTYLIRNAFDDYTFRIEKKRSKNKVIFWRGSSTHKPDFEVYGNDILEVIEDNPDFQFIFQTDITRRPENLAYSNIAGRLMQLPNFRTIKAVPCFDYFFGLKKLKPSLILGINANNDFNFCKSDISKIEGFYCGALCCHSDMPEWAWVEPKFNKKFLAEKTHHYLDLIRNNDPRLDDLYESQIKYLKMFRVLSRANQERYEVFRRVIDNYDK